MPIAVTAAVGTSGPAFGISDGTLRLVGSSRVRICCRHRVSWQSIWQEIGKQGFIEANQGMMNLERPLG